MKNRRQVYSAVFIGAGAAAVFAALRCAELSSDKKILLLERSAKPLSKLKISGGGRCNVTHSCFDPRDLVKNYPRGYRELLGPFSRFQPRDLIAWFEKRGVQIKREDDRRMFPSTDDSQTIIDCFLREADRQKITLSYKTSVEKIEREADGVFSIEMKNSEKIYTKLVMLATGSGKKGYSLAENLGHQIIPPVPSLFTFNIPDSPLHELSGVSLKDVVVSLPALKLQQRGPLLITHWGFSGPAVLKLSAWGARDLFDLSYKTSSVIDWLPGCSQDDLRELIIKKIEEGSKRFVSNDSLWGEFPKQLWSALIKRTGIGEGLRWYELSKKNREKLINCLKSDRYEIAGKTTFKQEFVTCGGVKLSEVNFKTMESKKSEGLFFGGEVLNIDGITGGFNFQAAWTTGFIAGSTMAERI